MDIKIPEDYLAGQTDLMSMVYIFLRDYLILEE